ncbi:MAG: ABC transporter permease, partial [Gammaproteobacteria bacterium]|nr:ABC transporter permease [Gammaproteobacteria bacterium]
SRTAEQQRQLAIHAALGGTKRDLFKTLFSQTSQLMFGSVISALVIAMVGFYVMQQFLSQQLPRVDELSVNGFTLSCALVIALVLALAFARLSASMINYKALNSTLQSSGKGTGIQVSKNIRKILIICQVAIVTTLVFVNISLLKDAISSIEQPLGFKTQNLTSLSLSVSATSMPEQDALIPIISELRTKLIELPQIKAVSLSRSPFNSSGQRAQTNVATNERYVVPLKYVDDSYFQMIEQPLIEGNYFSAADIKDQTDVMIVNDVFAKTLAPSGSALGKKIDFGSGPVTIIGVVKGTNHPGRSDVPMQSYRPNHLSSTAMTIELQPGATLSREQAVAVLKSVTSQFTVFDLTALETTKARLLFSQYTTAITSAILALLTFFLAGVGLYGILSYSIQLRSFEIGTRMAIGAKRRDLILLIIKDNASAIAIGVTASIIIMLALYIGYSEQLADYISLQLLPMFVVTVVLISMISLFACYWPLREFINRPAIHSLRGSD